MIRTVKVKKIRSTFDECSAAVSLKTEKQQQNILPLLLAGLDKVSATLQRGVARTEGGKERDLSN